MARGGFAAVAALALAGCASLPPGAVGHGAIRVDHMVMPAADVAGTDVAASAGFANRGGDDRLLGIDCAWPASVELHKVVRDGDKVSMTNTFPLFLPGSVLTEVKPPGIPLHFMLMGTTRAFKAGERIPMRLRFERAGSVEAMFVVVAKSADGWAAWPNP